MCGERYFSTVIAVDGAGLISSPAVSNGVILDTSAPVTRSTYISGQNNIENPSLEEIEETDNGVNVTVKCTDVRSQCLPRNWLIEGSGHVLTSVETSAQSGNAFLILHGSVSQNIGTVEGDKYKLSFYASHTLQSTTPLLSQEGYVEIPGMHRVFHLLKRSGNHDDEGFLEWFEHVYYFTAESTSTAIKIGSLGDRNAIALDNVNVQQLTQSIITGDISEPSAATAISVDVRTDSETFSVSANWNMIDIESPIVEYLWAIGTVKGGTQIQTFKSAGRSTHAIADDLILADGLPIYITVVVHNAADLHTAIYSDPYLIDLTPPVMCCLRDGPNAAVDAVYQTSSVISVHWNVSDQESGIEYCEWAVGLSPRSEVLLSFTRSEALRPKRLQKQTEARTDSVQYSEMSQWCGTLH
ncbi:uncharacterized protein [Ptychodera flava]|uniref:uncharacterized protein n=1 Tax=Ptychodera flava TaxID=63121 RepID=UPI00396A5837